MSEMIILIGNVGCGKSTLARKLARKDYVVVNMDSIQQMIGGGEYGLYDPAKKDVYHAAEEAIIVSALSKSLPVVIDRTNMDKKRRQRFIELGKQFGALVYAYDFGEGCLEDLQRRTLNSRNIPTSQWTEVWEKMKASYQAPSLDEGFTGILTPPKRYTFYAFDFDGTVVEHAFPAIGKPIPETIERIKELWAELSNIIIIWTCRSGDRLAEMRQYLLKNNIPFDFINENPMCDFGSPKIFAHEYYDDRNGVFPLVGRGQGRREIPSQGEF